MYLNILTESLDPIVRWLGVTDTVFNPVSILVRLLLAVLFSFPIGLERARKRHAAGVRTYMLVCIGASIVMMVDEFIVNKWSGDPARLGAQVISGIGFLGAGTILITSKNRIKGLTTAAGLWAAACMGLSIGAGCYTLALLSDALIIIVLALMPAVEARLRSKAYYHDMYVELDSRQSLKSLINLLRENDIKVDSIEKNGAYIDSGLSVYTIGVSKDKACNSKEIISLIESQEYVNFVEELRS